jgi:hypothetical protein
MPVIIQGLDHYLYTTQRDVFYLKLTHPDEDPEEHDHMLKNFGDYRDPRVQAHQKIATDWFGIHEVPWAMTGPSAVISGWHVLEGWSGEIYVGFDGWEDPKLKAWSEEFEINGTWSKYPEMFALLAIPYQDWVENGGIEKHEAYLKELEDPDFCP